MYANCGTAAECDHHNQRLLVLSKVFIASIER
jgi:hypothetical protein